jgi:hypothetical protein
VLLDVVSDSRFAIGQMFFHRGIDVHLLSHGVPHQLGNQHVRLVPALLTGTGPDLSDQFFDLPVVCRQDVDNVYSLRVGHFPLLGFSAT